MNKGRAGLEQLSTWALVYRARGEPTAESREALAVLCDRYHGPLLDFARRIEFDPGLAEDLVQGFLAGLVEPDGLRTADRNKGSFRAFVRMKLRHYAINVHDKSKGKRLGGDVPHVDVDDVDVASRDLVQDRLFDRAYARVVFDRALARLAAEQARGPNPGRFEALRERLVGGDEDATAAELAERLEISEVLVRVTLCNLRKRCRELVRAEVAETLALRKDVDAELAILHAALRGDG